MNFVLVKSVPKPLVEKKSRTNGSKLRSIINPDFEKNLYLPVLKRVSEGDIIIHWNDRFTKTAKIHLLYPPLIYAAQKLLPRSLGFHIGGATIQATSGQSSFKNGLLYGQQAAHLNLGTAVMNGTNMITGLADYFRYRPNAVHLAPNICRLLNMGISFEGEIAIQSAFLNQSDADIERRLHTEVFTHMLTFGSGISDAFLADSIRMTLNSTIQKFSNGNVEAIAKGILVDIKQGDRKERVQYQTQDNPEIFDGKQKKYFEFIVDTGTLRRGMSDLFKDLSFYSTDIASMTEDIKREVAILTESKTSSSLLI